MGLLLAKKYSLHFGHLIALSEIEAPQLRQVINAINEKIFIAPYCRSTVNNSNAFCAFSNAALLVDLDDFW